METTLFSGHSRLACCSLSRLETGMCTAFGKTEGTLARVHIGQVIMSISAPSYRARNTWLRQSAGPSSSSFGAERSISPVSGDLLSLLQMNLKTWWQKSSSSDASLIVVPWTNGWPCTHESIGTVHSLIMSTNQSYFPV